MASDAARKLWLNAQRETESCPKCAREWGLAF